MQSEREKWQQARQIRDRLKKETRLDLIADGYSNGTVSMAPRALSRKTKFKLNRWQYLAVCATLPIPDSLFDDFCRSFQIDEKTPIRKIKRLVKIYKEAIPKTPEAVDKHGLDYVMLDGKRYWIPPAASEKILDTIQEYIGG